MARVLLVSSCFMIENRIFLWNYLLTWNSVLHEYLLALFGCPIGELWDLEALSRLCEKNKRWSFFFASAPINIRGCIATPANALAVM